MLLYCQLQCALAYATVFAAVPATLNKKNIIVYGGFFPGKNISIKEGKNGVKISGKKAGKAKFQAMVGKQKLACQITVIGKKSKELAGGMKLAVKSDKYTVV